MRRDGYTVNEVEVMKQMRRNGYTYKEIGKKVHRSTVGVRAFFNRLSDYKDQWRAIGIKSRDDNLREVRFVPEPGTFKVQIPVSVIADREKRSNEERTQQQVMFGDPPFSQSALARRDAL